MCRKRLGVYHYRTLPQQAVQKEYWRTIRQAFWRSGNISPAKCEYKFLWTIKIKNMANVQISKIANISAIPFLILFSLEPILNCFKTYWLFMVLLAVVWFIILTWYILSIFKKGTPIQKYIFDIKKMSFINLLICILGFSISYMYKSSLIKFWVFIFCIEIINYVLNLKKVK